MVDFLLDEPLDNRALEPNYRHLIAATIALAWMDSVGHLESTFNTRKNRKGMMGLAQRWIKGEIVDHSIKWVDEGFIDCYDQNGRYKHWMECLDLCPDLEPEALAEDYAGAMKGWWEE